MYGGIVTKLAYYHEDYERLQSALRSLHERGGFEGEAQVAVYASDNTAKVYATIPYTRLGIECLAILERACNKRYYNSGYTIEVEIGDMPQPGLEVVLVGPGDPASALKLADAIKTILGRSNMMRWAEAVGAASGLS